MELTVYDIIKGPVVSEKAYKLNKQKNQLVLYVHIKATKPMVKRAIETLFNVKTDTVRTNIRKYSSSRVSSRRHNARPTIKKEKIAYVTLTEGYTLNLFDQSQKAPTAEAQKVEKVAT